MISFWGINYKKSIFLTTRLIESIIKWVFLRKEVGFVAIRIQSVSPGSPAAAAGINAGDHILSINKEPVLDEIDYQALSAEEKLTVTVSNGQVEREFLIVKDEWEPLGLSLDETQAMKPRHCCNHCLFCFVDQLPRGMRETLYVKDDDWRLSLMMGNYVTLTNVSEKEFKRILARRASPLYISVHATDPDVRCRMLRNPNAGQILEQLRSLKNNGLEFHCQIVICPGINDGAILEKTVDDLISLWPSARSVALVPVGLTMHRDGLARLKQFDRNSAGMLLERASVWQQQCLKELGTRFVFPSDEFYCLSGHGLPTDEEYEDYPQIENGVGLLRQFEQGCREAAEDLLSSERPEIPPRRILVPTGTSAHDFMEKLYHFYAPENTSVDVVAVPNRFFGETITVTGLIVGQDLIYSLKDRDCDEIWLPDTMLRDRTDCFLDDVTLEEVRSALGKKVRVIPNDGESMIRALWGLED